MLSSIWQSRNQEPVVFGPGLSSCPTACFSCSLGPRGWGLSCYIPAWEHAEELRPAAFQHHTCCATVDTAAAFLDVHFSVCLSVCLKCWLNKTCADLCTANVKILSKNAEKRSLAMNHKRQKRCFECKPFSILGALSCFSKRVLNFFAIFRLTCSIWCLWRYWAPGKITI